MSKFIKPKKVKKPKTEEELVPQDLLDKWGAVGACATAFTIIDKAHLPHGYHASVKSTLQFLAKLHENCMEEVLKHPKCDMLSEVRVYKESQIKKEATDGKVEQEITAEQ